MDTKKIDEVLRLHRLYLGNDPEGKKAYLVGAYLAEADLCRVNLSRANLYGVDLTRANLVGAYLTGANLQRIKGAVFFQAEGYICIAQEGYITIGHQRHSRETWAAFSDTDIKKMDGDPILWNKHKTTILSMNV